VKKGPQAVVVVAALAVEKRETPFVFRFFHSLPRFFAHPIRSHYRFVASVPPTTNPEFPVKWKFRLILPGGNHVHPIDLLKKVAFRYTTLGMPSYRFNVEPIQLATLVCEIDRLKDTIGP
jgi:hypothetical protein